MHTISQPLLQLAYIGNQILLSRNQMHVHNFWDGSINQTGQMLFSLLFFLTPAWLWPQ